MVRTGGVG
jgi:hypothetical protein